MKKCALSLFSLVTVLAGSAGAGAQPEHARRDAVGVTTAASNATVSKTQSLKKFLGKWEGAWYGSVTRTWMADQTLEIMDISDDNTTATVNYTFSGRTKKGTIRVRGRFEGGDLVIVFPSGSRATYRLSDNGNTLYGEFTNSQGELKAMLRRV